MHTAAIGKARGRRTHEALKEKKNENEKNRRKIPLGANWNKTGTIKVCVNHRHIGCHMAGLQTETEHEDNGLLLISLIPFIMDKGAKPSNLVSVLALVGQASGPPLDGWH